MSQNPRGLAYRRAAKEKAYNRRKAIVSIPGYNPYHGWFKTRRIGNTYEYETLSYIVYPRKTSCRRYFKKYTGNVAKHKDLPVKGNAYRKTVDLWWMLL